jgi:formate-nitrite transporter family protein
MKTKTSARTIAELPAFPVPDRDHIQGSIDAPIKLLEYGDYECPYCGQAYPVVKEIQKRLGKRLCFAFRNFPLINSHPHAEHAAETAEAAGTRGRFWEMHDYLFENQNALDDEDLAGYAEAIGLDVRQIMTEVSSGAHVLRVREDFHSGARSGVNGTPTFFINGKRYNGVASFEELLAALTQEFSKTT